MTNRIEGHCRCGQARFTVAGAPLITMACHCTGCRRMTGSAFSLSSLYSADAFALVAGDPVLGGLRAQARHYFCPACMSWLYTRPAGMDAFVNVRATLLGDAAAYRPFIETYTARRCPGPRPAPSTATPASPRRRISPALLAAFARQSGAAA
jgi:hypothetical protein